jgi:hypothetical protein
LLDRFYSNKHYPEATFTMAEEKRKKSQILPLLLAFLVFIATSSFYHAFHLLLTTDTGSENSIEISLKEFKLGAEQVKPHDVPAIKSPHDVPAIKSLPNPVLADGQESFSSCLLVMDDNNRLVEWLAYHYHVLPLRYLVVAVDPRSKTSPTDILNRWRQMGVHVEEWTDYDFMKPSLAARPVDDNAELHIKRDRHRIRQKWFYRQCLMHMGQANRTYVTMVDTDEYVTYNHKGQDQFEAWEQAQMKLHSESQFYEKKRIRPSQPPPTTAEAGALIQYIRQEKAANHPFFQRACISCPRLQFGAKESTLKKRQAHVPEQVDSERLDSLRFRKHAYRNDFVKNGLSKSIIDVSRIDYTNIPRIQSLHRPIKTICSPPWKDEWDSGLRINHYLGSWEGTYERAMSCVGE